MKDGWNKIKGYDVFVQDNTILKGKVGDRTVYPYKDEREEGCWVRMKNVSVNDFKKSDLYALK